MNARGVGGRPPAVLRINLNLRVILQIAVLLLLLWQARPLPLFLPLPKYYRARGKQRGAPHCFGDDASA